MNLDNRGLRILWDIVENGASKTEVLQEKLHLSSRQFDYSLTKINDYFTTKGLSEIRREKGYLLADSEQKDQIIQLLYRDNWTYEFTQEERVYLGVLILASENEMLSLQHFVDYFNVSRNTALQDIRNIETYLSNDAIQLAYTRSQGYILEGDEFTIRRRILDAYSMFVDNVFKANLVIRMCELEPDMILEWRQVLTYLEQTLKMQFTDERMRHIPYELALMMKRVIGDHHVVIDATLNAELYNTDEFKGVCDALEHIGFNTLSDDERVLITLMCISSNVSMIHVIDSDKARNIYQAINDVVTNFELISCVNFQNRDDLVHNIFQHIKPAYYRIRYSMNLVGPFEEIANIELYSDEFRIVREIVTKSIQPLETIIEASLPSVEIDLLTLIFGSWVRKQKSKIFGHPKALIVSPQGISMHKLLHTTLRELFPEFIFIDTVTVREFHQLDTDAYDLVFSPVYLETKKPLFVVSANTCINDRYELRNRVIRDVYGVSTYELDVGSMIRIIEKHSNIIDKSALQESLQSYMQSGRTQDIESVSGPRLSHVLSEDFIAITESVFDWQDAVRLAAKPLVDRGYITRNYIREIIRINEENPPYVIYGTELAIPHANPEDGVMRMGMSLLKINQGIRFGEGIIHVFVILAAVDKILHLPAVLSLANLSESNEDMQAIIETRRKEEIITLLKKYD